MSLFYYFTIFTGTLLLSIFFILLVKKLAYHFNILDYPDPKRKIHKKKTPLLGGLAIFFSFFIVLFFVKDVLISGNLNYIHWISFFIGACFLMFGGFLDDKYNLKPINQIIWPVLAILSIIIGGVGIERITNPLGGYVLFNNFSLSIFSWKGNVFEIVFWTDLFTFTWLILMMYTTKLLDGIDGLVTGVSAIGGLVIFLFTITTKYYQPDIGLTALIFTSACLGFLIFNTYPAKIFLGEGGSLLLGYILGVLAIISGGKIAITLLVLGLPLMDMLWTVIRRLLKGQNPFKNPDRKHLHHRLLNLGIGQRGTVLIFYIFSLIFGISALFLQSFGKFIALLLLVIIMFLIVSLFNIWDINNK
jgi:UDP-GlcNAc:undecaprenyl-phosphate GlcNAc-1-phosphate transferase